MVYEICIILITHFTLILKRVAKSESISKHHSLFCRRGNRPREFKVTSPRSPNNRGVRTKSQPEQFGPRMHVPCHFTESACQLFLFCPTPLPVPGEVFLKLHNSFHNSCGIFAMFDDTENNNDSYCVSALAHNGQVFKSLEHCARKIAEQKGFCIFVSRSRVVKGSIICVFTAKKLA